MLFFRRIAYSQSGHSREWRWHGHPSHDSRAGLPASALRPRSRHAGRLALRPSVTPHGQGSPRHFQVLSLPAQTLLFATKGGTR